jgi:hypothetical protein
VPLGRLPAPPKPDEVFPGIFVPPPFPGVDESLSFWKVQPTPRRARFPWVTGDEFLALPLGPIEDPTLWRVRPAPRLVRFPWLTGDEFLALVLTPPDDTPPFRQRMPVWLGRRWPDESAIIVAVGPVLAVSEDPAPHPIWVLRRGFTPPEEGQLALPLGPVSDDPFVRTLWVPRRQQVWIDDSVMVVVPGVGQILDDPLLWKVQPAPRRARFPWQTGDEFLALPLAPIEDPALWRVQPLPRMGRMPQLGADEAFVFPSVIFPGSDDPPMPLRVRSLVWRRGIIQDDGTIVIVPPVGQILSDEPLPMQRKLARQRSVLILLGAGDDGVIVVVSVQPGVVPWFSHFRTPPA